MNLILFEPEETRIPLPASDARARHVREVLARRPGEAFDCGQVDGPRGKAVIMRADSSGLHLAFCWDPAPPPPLPAIALIVGLPRPQTARKVLQEATTLGVARIVFFVSDKSGRSYADSTLWSSGEARRHLIAGAEQAFCTRLPEVALVRGLLEALSNAGEGATRLALDNYEATASFPVCPVRGLPAALAVGPERGWSGMERDRLREAGFTLVHMGSRVLRTETACVAGIALLRARLGLE